MKTVLIAFAMTLVFTGALASNHVTNSPQTALSGPINPNCVPNAPGCPWNWPPIVAPKRLS
jgi:hypothetical protein